MALLSELEAVTLRSTPATFETLHRLLLNLQGDDADLRLLRHAQDATASAERLADLSAVATRVVALAGSLLLSDQLHLNDQRFLALFIRMNELGAVAAASGFGGTDHLLRALGVEDTGSLLALARSDRQRFLKALMLLALDSAIPVDIVPLLQAEPMLGSLVYFRLLASGRTLSPSGERSRDRLLEAAEHVRPFIPKDLNYLVLLANAWMMCSYADTPHKHRVKPLLNRYLRAWMAELGLHDRNLQDLDPHDLPRSPQAGAPLPRRVLIAAEVMHSNHVQYRYFGQYIRQLRTRFHTVLVAEDAQVDEHVRALVDEVHTFRRGSSVTYLRELRDLIVGQRPDIIFWLSVGMRHWGVALANLRLAPLQLAGFGHGAFTFCDTIDFYLTESGYVAEPAEESDTGGDSGQVDRPDAGRRASAAGTKKEFHTPDIPSEKVPDKGTPDKGTPDKGTLDKGTPDKGILSERLLLLPDESLRFERSPHYQTRPVWAARRTKRHTLTAAVPSNLLKLNSSYLATLGAVQRGAEERGRRLRFKFFPNQQGIPLAMTTTLVNRNLQDASVMPMLGYQAYMDELSACHLNLSSFPYGSVHSVIDSLRLGLPVVVMEAVEPHARSDAMLLRRLRMPEWLICRCPEDYVACAVRLIVDDRLRIHLGDMALNLDVGTAMFGDATTQLGHEIVRAVSWAYTQRHAVSGDPRRRFNVADWSAQD